MTRHLMALPTAAAAFVPLAAPDTPRAERLLSRRYIDGDRLQYLMKAENDGSTYDRSSGRRPLPWKKPVRLDILFEDDALIAVNKPAGVVVHPTYKNVAGTLLDAMRSRGGDPAIVGRLDKDTSGIVIAAKSSSIYATLQRILASPSSDKEYIAIVRGSVDVDSGTIALPLRVDPADRRRVIVAESDGRASQTRFERIGGDMRFSVLRCMPITGRRHQIRVHLAARGWPVVGDVTYGEALAGFPRHALHAHRMSFPHPVTGASIRLEAPLPLELLQLLRSAQGSDRDT